MSNSVDIAISAEVSYTDGNKASFSGSMGAKGNISVVGDIGAFADALPTVKTLFTSLGGSLTCSPHGTSQKVSDVVCRFSVEGTVGSTIVSCAAEVLGGGSTVSVNNSDYKTIVTNFKSQIQSVISAVAGVTATIA